MRIVVQTSIENFYEDLKAQNIEGLTVQVRNTDSEINVTTVLVTLVVSISSTVAGEFLKEWLTNKLKDKPEDKTVINGNQINIDNLNITVISNAIESKLENKDHQSKSDDSKS